MTLVDTARQTPKVRVSIKPLIANGRAEGVRDVGKRRP